MSNVIVSNTLLLWRLNPKRHSSWKRQIRICDQVIWFITNLRRSVDGKIVGELLPSEVKDTEDWFIRSAQEESFAEQCRRRRAKLATQVMASLPDVQLTMSLQPFTHAVIDYSRIASLRGIPEVLFDNGSNFVKSDKELKDLVN